MCSTTKINHYAVAGTCIATFRPSFMRTNRGDMGMKRHRLTEQIISKGYTVRQICNFLNRRGQKVSYPYLYKCLQDRPNKTDRETYFTESVLDLLKVLPDLGDDSEELFFKIKERGFSISDVWRYHNRTRSKTYTYPAFWKSIRGPMMPYEQRIRVEAVKCLDEMTAIKKAGGTP